MKLWSVVWLLFVLFCCHQTTLAQGTTPTQRAGQPPSTSAATETKEKNLQEYTRLLRSNVRQQKAEIMGAMMQLDPQEAAKFWPIYSEYDAQLSKLNDLRVANIEEYAKNYDRMTDAKADELMQNALNFRKQRSDLLAKYYERVKASLGAVQAARFLQIENQLLLIIDLQIESALPTVG
jgi:hypothetical protein